MDPPKAKEEIQEYIPTPFFQIECLLESEWGNLTNNPRQLAMKLLHKDYCRIPEDPLKTQSFFELILVDTKSIIMTDKPDTKNPGKIAFKKMQILNILTPKEWGNPDKLRTFSIPFEPQAFNYWDYINAWTKVLFYQNDQFSISYFIFFKKSSPKSLPYWFHEWIRNFGPSTNIFPQEVLSSYEYFSSIYKPNEKLGKLQLFISQFQIPWILMIDYAVSFTNEEFPCLGKYAKIKWWNKTNLGHCSKNEVRSWVAYANAHYSVPIPQRKSNSEDEEIKKAKEEFKKAIDEAKTAKEISDITDKFNKRIEEVTSTSSGISPKSSPEPDYNSALFQDSQDPFEF